MNMLIVSRQMGKRPRHECPVYDTKQSDSEASVLETWEYGVAINPSSTLLAPDRVLCMGQIELVKDLQYLKQFNSGKSNGWYQIELLVLNSNA